MSLVAPAPAKPPGKAVGGGQTLHVHDPAPGSDMAADGEDMRGAVGVRLGGRRWNQVETFGQLLETKPPQFISVRSCSTQLLYNISDI